MSNYQGQPHELCGPHNTVALGANVSAIVNAINVGIVVPYGDYGTQYLYLFQAMNNGLGNIVYTIFDRVTKIGLSSYSVRYGAATTIRDIILMPFPKSEIALQYLILPYLNLPPEYINGNINWVTGHNTNDTDNTDQL